MALRSSVLFGMMALGLLIPSQQEATTREQAFHWFDKLGLATDLKRPFVQVNTWSESGDGTKQGFESFVGFQLDHEGPGFEVLTLTLGHYLFVPSRDQYNYERAEIMPKDFNVWAKSAIAGAKNPEPLDTILNAPSRPLQDLYELFIASRAADLRGENDASMAFYNLATKTLAPRQEGDLTFLQLLEERISTTQVCEAVAQVGDAKVPLTDVAPRFEKIASDFPKSEAGKRARNYANGLSTNISEDLTHKTLSDEELAALPVDQRIDELIYLLRTQNGYQWSQPGQPDVFSDFQRRDSPAQVLLKIGVPAVPMLMKALSDKHPTRTVDNGWQILTVGEASAQVISRIANIQMSWNGVSDDPTYFLKEANAWYSKFKRVGEKQTLIDNVKKGTFDSANQADELARKYPSALPEAVREALKHADKDSRPQLILSLTQVHTKEASKLGREQMFHGRDLAAKLAGACVVATDDPSAAVKAMIAVWNSPLGQTSDHMSFVSSLPEFLAASGMPSAVEVLAKGIHDRSPAMQSEVVEVFVMGEVPHLMFNSPFEDNRRKRKIPLTPRQETQYAAAVERLLVSELTNTRPSVSGMTIGNTNLSGYSVGGLAVYGLAQWFPKKYSFHVAPTRIEEDNLRITALNVWRKQHGLASLPLRQPPVLRSAPSSEMSPLIEAYLSNDPASSTSAHKAIVAKGFLAIPPLEARAKSLGAGNPDRVKLKLLASSLACVVTKASLIGKAKTAKLAQIANSFKGKQFTSQSWIQLVKSVFKSWPDNAGQLEITLTREANVPGIQMTIEALTISESNSISEEIQFSYEFMAGNTTFLSGGSGAKNLEDVRSYPFDGMIRPAKLVLTSPSQSELKISMRIYYTNRKKS